MEDRYFLLASATVLRASLIMQERAELVRCTWLFPFLPRTQKKNESFTSFFRVSFLSWSGMGCAVICLDEQRRNLDSEIRLFHQVIRVPGMEHYLLPSLLRGILKLLVNCFESKNSNMMLFRRRFPTLHILKYPKWEWDIFCLVNRKMPN